MRNHACKGVAEGGQRDAGFLAKAAGESSTSVDGSRRDIQHHAKGAGVTSNPQGFCITLRGGNLRGTFWARLSGKCPLHNGEVPAHFRTTLADKGIFRGRLGAAADADAYLEAMRETAGMMTDIVIRQVWAENSDVLTWFDLHTAIASPCATANWMKIADGRIVECGVLFDPREILAAVSAGHGQ